MRRFLFGLSAGVALTILLIVGYLFLLFIAFTSGQDKLPEGPIVLTYALDAPVREAPRMDPLALLSGGSGDRLATLVRAIDRAAGDPDVKGLLVRLGEQSIGLADAQELRAAIKRFNAAGKTSWVYADSFGEFQPANGQVYLASAFNQIWTQPIATYGLTGAAAQGIFLANALSALGVVPEVERVADYKTAMDMFTQAGFTPANREMTGALVESMNAQLVADIAADRGMAPEAVQAAMQAAPLSAPEALARGLITRTGYWDEVEAEAEAQGELASLTTYARAKAGEPPKEGAVALIYVEGAIAREGGSVDPLTGDSSVGGVETARAIRDAAEDDAVAAIVLRVDSPGGSMIGSETIARAVREAVAGGTPVVVSMGGVAGSGGYWIAAPASRIVAQGATLTGSIGIIAGKFVLTPVMHRFGVTSETLPAAPGATMWSATEPLTDEQRRRLETMLQAGYDVFVSRVAEGRRMDPARVHEIAQGRVWTGAQAKDLGLVDLLGGLDVAVAEARRLANLPADTTAALKPFPEPENLLEALLGGGGSVALPALRPGATLPLTPGAWTPGLQVE